MLRYRLSDAAQGDVADILAWSHEQFGQAARVRYHIEDFDPASAPNRSRRRYSGDE